MEINTEGIVVSRNRFGETSIIVTLFTKQKGLLKGLVRGAALKKDKSVLQLGNIVEASWKARLENHLGTYKLELKSSNLSTVFNNELKITTLFSTCELINNLLPEGDITLSLYETTKNLLHTLTLDDFFIYYIKWELILLQHLGYGLDFSRCTACNEVHDLYYVSPKTGRAVCKKTGEIYKNKLLLLPEFLVKEEANNIAANEKNQALKLTGYFLQKFCSLYYKKLTNIREKLVLLFCN